MQNFVLDGGTLNGDPQVWIEQTSASLSLQGSGEVLRGAAGVGTASVAFAGDGILGMHARLTGSAQVAMQGAGSILRGGYVVGNTAGVSFAAKGDFTRWVMIEGLSPVEFEAEGEIDVVSPVSGYFPIQFRVEGDGHVAKSHEIEGYAPIEVRTRMEGHVAKSAHVAGAARIELAAIGQPALRVMSPPGSAVVEFALHGAARLGARVSLEGDALIEFYGRGYSTKWHYVFAEGSAAIEIAARAEKFGLPVIPDHYVAAPLIRLLRVNEETRRFIVPAERRL